MNALPFSASPHCNQRPDDCPIDMIVLHAISLPDGQFGAPFIHDFFMGTLAHHAHPSFADLADMQVSAHFVVHRNGHIEQFVPTHLRAWHAGESIWQGRQNCNDFSIGIEIIGDERRPFTKRQYQQTASLCQALLKTYPSISTARIVGHQAIAPGRKWDPGKQWSWPTFIDMLKRSHGLKRSFQQN